MFLEEDMTPVASDDTTPTEVTTPEVESTEEVAAPSHEETTPTEVA